MQQDHSLEKSLPWEKLRNKDVGEMAVEFGDQLGKETNKTLDRLMWRQTVKQVNEQLIILNERVNDDGNYDFSVTFHIHTFS